MWKNIVNKYIYTLFIKNNLKKRMRKTFKIKEKRYKFIHLYRYFVQNSLK